MKSQSTGLLPISFATWIAVGVLCARSSQAADETAIGALAKQTHFHGIAVDVKEPSRIYLATHHGLYVVARDGKARAISEARDDFMGFTTHPADASILYASGHPTGGGNLGFIASTDGGRSWSKVANGVGGPVDFHQMDVSKKDPQVIYGVYGDLQRSVDNGRTWKRVGPAPQNIIALAASSRDTDRLYGATETGLLQSTDGGKTWNAAHPVKRAATMVSVTRDARIYAFIESLGLIRASEDGLAWQVVSNAFGGQYVLHLAVDPTDEQKLYVVTFDPKTKSQDVLASRDGGAGWATLGAE